MDEQPSTRGQIMLGILRESVVVILAFVAGVGGYFGQLQNPPVWPRDYIAAVGAGALLALAKMIPTGGQSRG